MKILHTSDWHLGQTLYGYDRMEDHSYFFQQLANIIEEEHPDALVVSGDIYDVSNPSTTNVALFNDFLLSIKQIDPSLTIVVISGNHDSASKIEVYRKVWKEIGINVIGKIERIGKNYSFKENIIKVEGKGYIAAVPFINRAFLNMSSGGEVPEVHFFSQLAEELKYINVENLPVIVMAHLTVAGSDMRSHRLPSIGNVNSIPISTFSKYFDYLALGHIHKPQTLDDNGKIRYSGSPLAISFDEDFEHSVSIVEVSRTGKNEIKERVLPPLRPLVTFPKEPTDFKTAIKALAKYPDDKECYIRLNVEQEADLPMDCEEQAYEITKDKKCRYCLIKYKKILQKESTKTEQNIRVADFIELSPQELAETYFRSIGMNDDKVEEYSALLSEIEKELMKNRQK